MRSHEAASDPQRHRHRRWTGFGHARRPVRLLLELAPVLLAKLVAALLLWWLAFGHAQ